MSVIVIGAGQMAIEYVKVFNELKIPVKVVGQGRDNVSKLSDRFEGKVQVYEGGLEKNLQNLKGHSEAIVTVDIPNLYRATKTLIEKGFKKILVEKPAAIYLKEIEDLNKLSKKNHCKIFVGYNRRFYQSTLEAKRIINLEGLSSVHFEFTELTKKIDEENFPEVTLEKWFMGNSSHVVDLVFYLCGMPKKLNAYQYELDSWHSNPRIFIGNGILGDNIPFSYHSNWCSPGRWRLDIMTQSSRLIFSPLEKLQKQKLGQFDIENVNLDYTCDEKFKPGLYVQIKSFIEDEFNDLCSLNQHLKYYKNYMKISGYED